jgi:hypothetical protein
VRRREPPGAWAGAGAAGKSAERAALSPWGHPRNGGLSPIIATALLSSSGGNPTPLAAYLVAPALITLVAVYLAAETHQA